jgi:hypothetical protein
MFTCCALSHMLPSRYAAARLTRVVTAICAESPVVCCPPLAILSVLSTTLNRTDEYHSPLGTSCHVVVRIRAGPAQHAFTRCIEPKAVGVFAVCAVNAICRNLTNGAVNSSIRAGQQQQQALLQAQRRSGSCSAWCKKVRQLLCMASHSV